MENKYESLRVEQASNISEEGGPGDGVFLRPLSMGWLTGWPSELSQGERVSMFYPEPMREGLVGWGDGRVVGAGEGGVSWVGRWESQGGQGREGAAKCCIQPQAL